MRDNPDQPYCQDSPGSLTVDQCECGHPAVWGWGICEDCAQEEPEKKMSNRFTAYRFPNGSTPEAIEIFAQLGRAGLLPVWAMEAPSKLDPAAKRSLLINLPKFNRDAFRAWQVRKALRRF